MQINDSKGFSDDSNLILNELINESQTELDESFALLKKNEEELEEVNQKIKELDLKTDPDLSIFSPRGNTDSSVQLEQAYDLKNKLTKENDVLTSRYQKCQNRVFSLQKIEDSISTSKHTFDNKTKSKIYVNDIQEESKMLVLDIQEKERQRIARDLHDTSLQSLIHLIHKLELCSKYIDVDPIQANLELASCNKHLKDLINESRIKIFNLRPMSFDDLGFAEVMRRLKINLQEQSDMEIDFEVDDIYSDESLILITIYRIIQEACNNAVKHSCGSRLSVQCQLRDDILFCKIEDNGIGFSMNDASKKNNHFGMIMLQEQVKLLSGEFHVISELGKGTTVEVQIPSSVLKGVSK